MQEMRKGCPAMVSWLGSTRDSWFPGHPSRAKSGRMTTCGPRLIRPFRQAEYEIPRSWRRGYAQHPTREGYTTRRAQYLTKYVESSLGSTIEPLETSYSSPLREQLHQGNFRPVRSPDQGDLRERCVLKREICSGWNAMNCACPLVSAGFHLGKPTLREIRIV